MSTAYIASDIKGFSPALDARVSKELFALSGRNYVFETLGPRSAFGSRLLSHQPLRRPGGAQSARIEALGRTYNFYFAADAIMLHDEQTNELTTVLAIPDTTGLPDRWTYGFLNSVFFFCHKRVGLVFWNRQTDEIGFLSEQGAPAQALAIKVNKGRLVIIDLFSFTFSAPFDGFNFTPGLGLAGFQTIAQHVSGLPIALTSYSKGFMVWTTEGVMKAEYSGDEVVFRYQAVNIRYRPINAFCICQMDDESVVILDPRGFYATNGDGVDLYTPLFSEFMLNYLRLNKLQIGGSIRLDWDTTQQRLYVSVQHPSDGPVYGHAFVGAIRLDKWGEMNHPHYGTGPAGSFGYGYVDDKGYVRQFHDEAENEGLLPASDQDLLRGPGQSLTQRVSGNSSWVVGSSFRARSREIGQNKFQSGWYAAGAKGPSTLPRIGLDSRLDLGYVRSFDLDSNDRLTEITQIQVGSVESRADGTPAIDLNIVDGVYLGGEDLQERPVAFSTFDLTVFSTLDGSSVFNETTPTLARFTPGAKYYSLSAVGVWHIVRFSAVEPGDMYHIRSLEMTYVDAGKVQ